MKKLCIACLLVVLALVGQASAFTISLNPASQTMNTGSTGMVNVDIALSGTEALNGFDLKLSFDPAILGFAGFSTTLFNSFDPLDPAFNYVGGYTYDPLLNPSSVSFSGFVINPAGVLPGNMTVASILFTGVATGTSPMVVDGFLDLGNIGLDSVLAGAAASAVAGAPSTVVPEPGTFATFAVGLLGFVLYRTRVKLQPRTSEV